MWQKQSFRLSNVNFRKTYSDVPHYAVILWDNDGVLVDTERWYYQATREVFAAVGIDLTVELYFERFLSRSRGTSTFASVQGLREADIAAMQASPERALSANARAGGDHHCRRSRDACTIAATLRDGNRDKFPSPAFETMHRRTGLLEFFDFFHHA